MGCPAPAAHTRLGCPQATCVPVKLPRGQYHPARHTPGHSTPSLPLLELHLPAEQGCGSPPWQVEPGGQGCAAVLRLALALSSVGCRLRGPRALRAGCCCRASWCRAAASALAAQAAGQEAGWAGSRAGGSRGL